MSKPPTPDELGEMLQAGEITREEAVEIMAQRARAEAFNSLYSRGARTEMPEEGGSGDGKETTDGPPQRPDDLTTLRRRARIVTIFVVLTILALLALALGTKLM